MKRFVLDARSATDHFPGIGRYVSTLARAMTPQLGGEEELIVLHDPSRSSRWRLPAAAANVRLVANATSPFALSQQWQVPRLLRTLDASLYHSPFYLMPYWCVVPTLVTLFDLTPRLFPRSVSMRARIGFRLATRLALRQASLVLTASAATRRAVLEHYGLAAGHAVTVPLASEPHFQPQTAARVDALRHRYKLPARFALYLGINKPHKNLLRLLDAWQVVCRDVSAASLVIGGAWDRRYPQAREHAARLKLTRKVRFLGELPEEDLPALYSAATAFVFPSRSEGFGLPVLEAMACGTAVACSDVSSLPEVGGRAPLYFDPNDVEEMAAQMVRLLKDASVRERCRRRGLRQAQEFSWERTARQTLQVYRDLVA